MKYMQETYQIYETILDYYYANNIEVTGPDGKPFNLALGMVFELSNYLNSLLAHKKDWNNVSKETVQIYNRATLEEKSMEEFKEHVQTCSQYYPSANTAGATARYSQQIIYEDTEDIEMGATLIYYLYKTFRDFGAAIIYSDEELVKTCKDEIDQNEWLDLMIQMAQHELEPVLFKQFQTFMKEDLDDTSSYEA